MPVIESAPGGELTTVPKTYGIPLTNGSNQDYWAKLLNLYTALGIPQSGQMLNGKISPAVSSNDLVLSLLTDSGSAPSADDPVYINIGGTVRKVTAATTCTLADGTNWMNLGSTELATLEQDLFAYAIWDSNSSVAAISPSRYPAGRVVSNFSATTTNEKHLGNYANFTATDPVCVVGRFAATLSAAGTSHVWTVPAYTNENLIQEPIYQTRELSWNPVWTGLTTTSGTQTAKYFLDRTAADYHIEFVFGASSAITGNVSHTLPFSRSASYGGSLGVISGTLRLQDTGAGGYVANPIFNGSATSIDYRVINVAGTYAVQAQVSSTVPFTWVATDEIYESTRYFI